MTAYRPRRSGARWMQDAPEYVLACYDNGGPDNKRGGTVDRYTVMFGGSLWNPEMGRTVFHLDMSNSPSHPQGYSQWGEMPASSRTGFGKHVRWLDLPEHIREHVVRRATQD